MEPTPKEYPCIIEITNPDDVMTLTIKNTTDEVTTLRVTGVADIVIYDHRNLTSNAVDLQVFSQPGLVSTAKKGKITEVHIKPLPKGTRTAEVKHKLWIASEYPGNIGARKFLMFVGASNNRDTISFATLFRFR